MEIHETRPLPSAQAMQSPRRTSNLQALPPLITSPATHSTRSPAVSRPLSQASKRESRSSHLTALSVRSRPQSTVFPAFHSSLAYTHVRDFAYPAENLLHYGTPPPSEESTPVVQKGGAQVDDAHEHDWKVDRSINEPRSHRVSHLPQTAYDHDGPPWSEDEDLHSPIVTSARHKKTKSASSARERSREAAPFKGRAMSYDDEAAAAYLYDFPSRTGGPSDAANARYDWHPHDMDRELEHASPDSATAASPDPPLSGSPDEEEDDDGDDDEDESRYSKDYQFTIASPDEEMHGKAVALYDFTRENENELPLVEGQVLWVSYRHGQGWLVAQDPKSGESGLVPEEYVRLVRDIEGGLLGLNGGSGGGGGGATSPDLDTPVSGVLPELVRSGSASAGATGGGGTGGGGNGNGGAATGQQHYTPVVSHFSTSSRDLQRYPQHLLGGGGSSQTSTPVLGSEAQFGRHGSASASASASADVRGTPLEEA